ncbi:class I SAM-dependent methyltransferase [Acidocella aromatica]|uniref:SAM-dependent methyltransferase n=1 Tax=Acidocella aromatica TaxID=1303579 RepID=A0A840VHE1_9PROT|nr:methyltransferase domain-containing protein [Acidocella aromatica]MBB5374317.1 SAM-dependent methyltransferase [Acidocella aromatica]
MPDQNTLIEAALGLLDRYIKVLQNATGSSEFNQNYYLTHRARFARTLELIPAAKGNKKALEIGATAFFQVALREVFGYGFVAGTAFSERVEEKIYRRTIDVAGHRAENLTLSINVENDIFPFPDASLDFVLCCEVIEHLDVDPMFMMSEINRICALGGQLLLTTPNCCSARNVNKMLNGWRPHFHMQYYRNRSPYRHNFEYDVHALVALVKAAGFEVEHVASHDVFEAPMPDIVEMLNRQEFPTDFRGDCLFLMARKTCAIRDRWPAEMYVTPSEWP